MDDSTDGQLFGVEEAIPCSIVRTPSVATCPIIFWGFEDGGSDTPGLGLCFVGYDLEFFGLAARYLREAKGDIVARRSATIAYTQP